MEQKHLICVGLILSRPSQISMPILRSLQRFLKPLTPASLRRSALLPLLLLSVPVAVCGSPASSNTHFNVRICLNEIESKLLHYGISCKHLQSPKDPLIVTDISPGSPAYWSGITAGDQVMDINMTETITKISIKRNNKIFCAEVRRSERANEFYQYGQQAEAKSDEGTALLDYKKAADLDPQNETYKAAIIRIRWALSPNLDNAKVNDAVALWLNGEKSTAFLEISEVVRGNPNNCYALFNLGVCYEDGGDYKAALTCYERADSTLKGIEQAVPQLAKYEELRPYIDNAITELKGKVSSSKLQMPLIHYPRLLTLAPLPSSGGFGGHHGACHCRCH